MGYVPGLEMKQFKEALSLWVSQSIAEFDTDSDGTINTEEFVVLMKNAKWDDLRPESLQQSQLEYVKQQAEARAHYEKRLAEVGEIGVLLDESGFVQADKSERDVEAAMMALGAMHKADLP